jgi:hypothetical protein
VTDVQQMLDSLVPERAGEFGEWDDVLARAGVGRDEPAASNAPRRGVVAALIIVAAIVVPALIAAALTRTNVIFSDSKPAPNVVKKRFADLGFGSPPRFAIGVQAAKARNVGTFRIHGRRRSVWVAPTRFGGFCIQFESAFTGCVARASERHILSASYDMGTPQGTWISAIGGWAITRAARARLELAYADGSTDDIPYVHVSPPIEAGFFWFDVPKGHSDKRTRATALYVKDANGRTLATQRFAYEPRRPIHVGPMPRGKYVPPSLPTRSDVPPSKPIQRGSGNGVSVTAGANGVVLFDATRIDPHARALIGRGVGLGCFKLTREFGIFDTRGIFFSGRFAPSAAVRLFGLSPPLDGCEIQGSYGHRWPDRNGSHSAVEIPLTDTGRRYFADRVAARDLALFVRTAKVQRVRKLTGAALVAGLSRYPIVRLGSALSSPPLGKIGYALEPDGVVFVERSASGHRFEVEVRHRRIVKQNLKPYAFVF